MDSLNPILRPQGSSRYHLVCFLAMFPASGTALPSHLSEPVLLSSGVLRKNFHPSSGNWISHYRTHLPVTSPTGTIYRTQIYLVSI